MPEPASGEATTPASVWTRTPPQMPSVEPGGMTHGRPTQQSAVLVQAPPLATQVPPHLLSMQGLPQQSALVAHTEPAGGGALVQSTTERTMQRGMPSASRRQHFSGALLQLLAPGSWTKSGGSQQLFSALQL